MSERLNKIRQENPKFDREMVDTFAKKMPKLLNILIDGIEFDNHIGTKEVAKLAESYITNNKGEHIGFKWEFEQVAEIVKNYIDIEQAEFYPFDIWVWANVKYGDMGHITNEPSTIIRYAISELTDEDFPFYDASQKAYCWLKKHIENEEG